MDYESQQLDAYETADAERFLIGSVKKPEPEPEIFGVPLSELEDASNKVKSGAAFVGSELYRMGVGGVRDAGQSIIKFGRDILEAEGEKFLEASGLRAIDQAGNVSKIRLSIPAPRLPDVAEPQTFAAQLGRDFVQFGVGYLASPNKFGVLNPILRSGSADAAFFDPEEGGFIRPLIDLGVLPEALEFLAVDDVNEESLAEDRLRARLQMAGEGALAGGLVDGMIKTLKIIKNDKRLLRASAISIAAATGATVDPDEAEGMPAGTLIRRLSKAENTAITRDATTDGVVDKNLVTTVKEKVLSIKNQYPTSDGWLPISVNPGGKTPSFKVNKKGEIEIKWNQPSYAFHVPKGNTKITTHKRNLVNRTVTDVNDVLQRAQNGDEAAVAIINQANWYRSMRSRLRQEFGGLGDVFADILGATSAQTNVQVNYESALNVLRRFTKGEFDAEIAEYEKLIESGEPRGPNLFGRDKDPNDPFKLIRKASGALFQTNSAAATEALLDMFRQVKKGSSPKTINFTGNLIGFGNEATIDVWAARYLRDAAGLPRIPPPVEKAVAGNHLTGSTFDDPKIGGEFGFGQEVFSEAATILNNQGGIKAFDPNLGDLGPDDLQALVWFLEKEKWTKNGWTNKAGEGGSLDYESVFGGSPDRERVAELRSIINAKGSSSEQIAEAKAELQTLEGEPQRIVAGVSRERPDQRPTNPEQAELAAELTAPLKSDETVIGYQANNTYGEFMGEAERALNFEIVTQTNFDPTSVTKALVEAGRKYDQDAVFISKVVKAGTANARPGVEIYFRDRQGADYAQQITALLRDKGIDGFTFVTDARQADRVDVQATGGEDIAGLVGIRFQYIPEFDDAFDASRQQDIFEEKAELFADVMEDIGKIDGVTYADVVYYDTTVFKNTDRSGTEWINGGTSYEEHLGGAVGETASEVGGQRDLFDQATP